MDIQGRIGSALAALILLLFGTAALAGDVAIRHAAFNHLGGDRWRVDVTLEHDDTGWEHYADAWRIVTPGGEVLGVRTLFHPHENEQPFTRSLTVAIPGGTAQVLVEARDKQHGWSPDRLAVDLQRESGDRFDVTR